LGVRATRIDEPDALSDAIRQAFNGDRPTLLDVQIA
jgi:thiamine pyrophosphate-dependent acetolactate synthase large subunit-like protein